MKAISKRVNSSKEDWITATSKDLYLFNMRFGLKHLIVALDYFRFVEYPLAIRNLKLSRGMKVLDIGSGGYSPLPAFFAANGCFAYATDIDEKAVYQQLQNIKRAKLDHVIKEGHFRAEREDAKTLSYPDNFFDRITAVSSIEHNPGDGDIKAAQEIARTLKKGGLAVITVPFNYVFCEFDGFERKYDEKAIKERLVEPSGLVLLKKEYVVERRFSFSHYWYRSTTSIKHPFRPLMPLASKLFLNITEGSKLEKAKVVCLTLQKFKS